MSTLVQYIPLLTTVVALCFAVVVLRRFRSRPGSLHLLWWSIGLLTYAAGTLTESVTTLTGWHAGVFRAWYITGALLGGAPLAQGTVYLLLPKKAAHWLAVALITVIVIAGTCVIMSPIRYELVESSRLSGQVLGWSWVRGFSPLINLYAVIFLVGGAIYSAVNFIGQPANRHRFVGNVWIAAGAILPGIGGTFTRFGHTEVLYVTEFLGLLAIYTGYRFNTSAPAEPITDRPERASRGNTLRPVRH